MSASFTAIAKIILEANPDGKSSILKETQVRLEVSKNQDKSVFIDPRGLPTKEGVKPLTQALLQGLVGNIHQAHEKGFWDSAAHLRYIIAELTRGFVEVPTVGESVMKDEN